MWPNSKIQIVANFKNSKMVTKPKNTNCDKTEKLKKRQDSTTEIVTKLKKNQIATKSL